MKMQVVLSHPRRIGRASHNALRTNYIITFDDHVISHFAMEFLEIGARDSKVFQDNSTIILHCLDFGQMEKVVIESCP